ncbi:hypothetical protein M514_05331 [Trichuris suis]|uniref:N-alpha-acetyltransferase 40 n=1 Tax=Trichuris suis TaxID=68888 RepID=A0A085NQ71_9BILA|nr:hypothetical protein M513_05331 [Trichuris suis]KFD71617.1 hypothetical protein M514_05331 [Trichuris suis]KHJ42207.1 hypothetical protein D918_07739 [Trichuris suis]
MPAKRKDIGPLLVRTACQKSAQELSSLIQLQPSFRQTDIYFAIASGFGEEDFEMLMMLLEENMRPYYESSEWGWNQKAKRKEMGSSSARYLLARCKETRQFAGFSHFRFVMDYGIPVLYCYEIQVASAWRRAGLGSFMLETLYRLAEECKMKKVVATVFRHNEPSLNFFKKQLFLIDASSPHGKDYVILSRNVRKKK